MNILLTGASGFIGSVLLRKLIRDKQNVSVVLRKDANTWRINDLLSGTHAYQSDFSDLHELTEIVKKVKPNIIYHLAANGAYSYQNDPEQIIKTNFLGSWNLLRACNYVSYDLFVNTGSSSEYGFKKTAMCETDVVEPASYYAVTKCAQTLLCSHIAKQEKRPIVTLRPFSVYGSYEEPKRFIPTLMKSLLFHKEMQLVDPDVARDYIYVDDVVDAYLKIDELKRNTGEYFNIGTGVQSTIKDVVDMAMKITGKKTVFHWGRMKNRNWDTNVWVADISKAKKILKWNPRITLGEGLKKNWEWFQKNSRYYT